jgi:hypothetical protein
MLKVLAPIFFGFVLYSPALAEEYVLPATNPIASVAFPDAWKSSIYDKGVEAISGTTRSILRWKLPILPRWKNRSLKR